MQPDFFLRNDVNDMQKKHLCEMRIENNKPPRELIINFSACCVVFCSSGGGCYFNSFLLLLLLLISFSFSFSKNDQRLIQAFFRRGQCHFDERWAYRPLACTHTRNATHTMGKVIK